MAREKGELTEVFDEEAERKTFLNITQFATQQLNQLHRQNIELEEESHNLSLSNQLIQKAVRIKNELEIEQKKHKNSKKAQKLQQELENSLYQQNINDIKAINNRKEAAENRIQNLALKRLNMQERAAAEKEARLAEIKADNAEKQFEFEVQKASAHYDILQKLEDRNLEAKKAAQEDYLAWAQGAAEAEIAKAEKNGALTDAQKQAIIEKYQYTEEMQKAYEKKALKAQEIADKKAAKSAAQAKYKETTQALFSAEASWDEKKEAWKSLTHKVDPETGESKVDLKQTLGVMTKALSDFTKQLDKKVDEIAANKAAIDTRLQGSNNKTNFAGSYWEKMSKDIVGAGGLSPFFKQETIVAKLQELVGKGISYNVTQRAFLDTVKDKVATTFDAADGTLLRLVRIQNKDSTAARLGMESALNSFLNNMYETTEYMSDIMSSIKGNLEEAMSLMSAENAVDFEYQVQKWMGSLYSVGMSQEAVQGIAGALGKLAAGDIDGIIGSEVGNLMVMAANESGMSIATALSDGLDAEGTNQLLTSVVSYLGNIYDQSKDNLVVQQQMAKIYGMSASDLKAAANLATDKTAMKSTIGSDFSYQDGLNQLLDSLTVDVAKRTSIGEMITNATENLQYTMAAGMANNPVLYGLNKMAGALENLTGGIALPFLNVAGFGVDLNTSVADLMRVGAMSGGILSSMGALFGGGGGLDLKYALNSLSQEKYTRGEVAASDRMKGVLDSYLNPDKKTAPSRGMNVAASGLISRKKQNQEAENPMASTVGNASGDDVKDKTMADAENDTGGQMVEAKESEDASTTSDIMDGHIVDIYNLLQEAINGANAFNVKLDSETLDRLTFSTGV